MSDTYRRYRAIKQAIMQFYQPRPTGHREKHLNTLVALICGLTGGKHAHLPTIADHAPSNWRQAGKSDQALPPLPQKRPPDRRWLVSARRRGTAHHAGDAANPAGDGRQCGWAWLSGLDAECGLPRACLAALLGGRQRTQRSFSSSNPSCAARTGPSDHAQGCARSPSWAMASLMGSIASRPAQDRLALRLSHRFQHPDQRLWRVASMWRSGATTRRTACRHARLDDRRAVWPSQHPGDLGAAVSRSRSIWSRI